MTARGVHFALTSDQLAKLLKADGDEAVRELVTEEIEEAWDRDWLVETDQAWDAIHRCLTDDTLDGSSGSPVEIVVLYGQQLYNADDYIVSLKSVADVVEIHTALMAVTKEAMKKRYFAIDADDYGGFLNDEDWEYTWDNFVALREFYNKAAEAGRAVIFTVDQ